jgi:hypothetical protein
MGAWGAGIFDNDAAMDVVVDALGVALTEIEGFWRSNTVTVDDLDAVMACVAIHLTLHDRCHANPPNGRMAEEVRRKALDLFAQGIDSLRPTPDYRLARRAVLEETLAAYVEAARPDRE